MCYQVGKNSQGHQDKRIHWLLGGPNVMEGFCLQGMLSNFVLTVAHTVLDVSAALGSHQCFDAVSWRQSHEVLLNFSGGGVGIYTRMMLPWSGHHHNFLVTVILVGIFMIISFVILNITPSLLQMGWFAISKQFWRCCYQCRCYAIIWLCFSLCSRTIYWIISLEVLGTGHHLCRIILVRNIQFRTMCK
jgi:hypothetical protein